MTSEYLAIFEQRGRAYDTAMQTYPHARDAEFERLLDLVDTQHCQHILDVPSGGGYLQKFFPADVQIDSIEPCQDFAPQSAHLNSSTDLEALSLPERSYQLVVCLAAIHHIHAKQDFFQQCQQALLPGGYFCLGDIGYGHSIGQFLDSFAGKHNGTGHHGHYISPEQIQSLADNTGLKVINCEEKPCSWHFANTQQMLEFCRLLFGLKWVDDAELIAALRHYIGFTETSDQTQLHWRMLYATMIR